MERNLSALGAPPQPQVIEQARLIMGQVQARLDEQGEVLVDETLRETDDQL
ncbi:hypothetical protein [Sphaerisporangium album]|uniref:hypothetical protein n=1 Tax=Sphaerisporangium album TaxID=509200 RepID=UPI0015F0F594|nr:hypothetical protein [Sphaerisporangium album]